MARRLEDQRDLALEHVRIGAKLIDMGAEDPTIERLEFMQRQMDRAVEAQRKIDRKARRARVTA